MTANTGGETPMPPLCSACGTFHNPAATCPAFKDKLLFTKEELEAADAEEAKEVDHYKAKRKPKQ